MEKIELDLKSILIKTKKSILSLAITILDVQILVLAKLMKNLLTAIRRNLLHLKLT